MGTEHRDQCVRRDAIGAETVQDGSIEPGRSRHRRIDVQRVRIAAQSIQRGLVRRSVRIDTRVGRPIGRDRLRRWTTAGWAAEAAVAAEKCR